jgi:hypothetical protein
MGGIQNRLKSMQILQPLSNFLSTHLLEKNDELSSSTWKELYILQHTQNRTVASPKEQRWYDKLPRLKKALRVPVFGEGLETSAKSLIYRLMWNEKSPYKVASKPHTFLVKNTQG